MKPVNSMRKVFFVGLGAMVLYSQFGPVGLIAAGLALLLIG